VYSLVCLLVFGSASEWVNWLGCVLACVLVYRWVSESGYLSESEME